MASRSRARPRCAAPSSSPPAASAPPAPTPSSAASSSTAGGAVSARAGTAAPAARTPRSHALRAARRAGPRRHRRRHPRALQPHRPHRPLRPGADRRRGRPRRRTPSPTPTRSPAGGAETLRAAGRRGRGGLLADEAARRQRRLADRRCAAAARSSRGSTPPPSTAGSPPPTAPAAGSPSPQSRADVHRLRAEADAVVVGSGTAAGRRPARSTVATPTGDAARAGQPLRVVVRSARCGRRRAARAACCDDAGADRSAAAHRATRPHGCSPRLLPSCEVRHVRAARGRSRRSPARSSRAGLVDEVVGYLAPVLLGAGPPAARRRRDLHASPTRCASMSPTSHASAPTADHRRPTAPPRRRT